MVDLLVMTDAEHLIGRYGSSMEVAKAKFLETVAKCGGKVKEKEQDGRLVFSVTCGDGGWELLAELANVGDVHADPPDIYILAPVVGAEYTKLGTYCD